MKRFEWHDHGFTIVEWGNGQSYEIYSTTGQSVFLQGDCATEWFNEYDNIAKPEIKIRFLRDTVADYQLYREG